MNLSSKLKAFCDYATRHPIDCLLRGIRRKRLLKELHSLAVRVINTPISIERTEAYALQCECVQILWNGYDGLKDWFYGTSTTKLENIKRVIEEKLSRIEGLTQKPAK